jgi:protein subunit release factor A
MVGDALESIIARVKLSGHEPTFERLLAILQVGATKMLFIEIRAGEGGDDAKSLVREQAGVYAKACKRSGL